MCIDSTDIVGAEWACTLAIHVCLDKVIVTIDILYMFQMTLGDILDVLKGFVRGKPYFPGWLRNSTIRAGFLVCSTLLLLFARIKVMGAQLPIFTRYIPIQICVQLS